MKPGSLQVDIEKMSVDNYDIMNIIGNNINSATYKVKSKKTGDVFQWWTVDYEKKSKTDKEYLLEEIKKRSSVRHPNLLKFFSYIDQEENKILYIMTEYCYNGSLKDVINSCLINKTHMSEELVCKILYQIAFTIKTTESYNANLNLNELFLDEEFNIKLFNFKVDYKISMLKELKTCQLGLLIYEICTFKIFKEKKLNSDLKCIEKIYSQSLLALIICLIRDNTELKRNIDKILCHSTVLLMSTQWLKDKSFINNEKSEKLIPILKYSSNHNDTQTYCGKLETLRNKENYLQIREQQLNEREYKLILKERKIMIMEKGIKEKLQQAELYLKRCKETKPTSNDNLKCRANQKQKIRSYDDLDATYVSCGDSVLMPTSSKLNVNKIVKPATFTRTLSERRIRFKGHSPLKEIDYNKRSTKQSKSQKGTLSKKKSGWLTCSEETDKSSTDGSTSKKVKQLFSGRNTYENDTLTNCDNMQCKPITWTEENKRYAFELLKMMNIDKENHFPEVKHTYL